MLMSFAKTWPQFLDGSKTVTRRMRLMWTTASGLHFVAKRPPIGTLGWNRWSRQVWRPAWIDVNGNPRLEPGQIIEGCEWSPRVGKRWVCEDCGWQGPTKWAGPPVDHSSCTVDRRGMSYRAPARGVYARHLGSTIVTLGAADIYEAELEGFPGLSWAEFCDEAFPGVPLDIQVTRIRFERCEAP